MSSLYSRDIDGLFLFVSFYDHPHLTFNLSALPQSEYSEAGGRGLNVKMDLDHCSRLKIDSDCGRAEAVACLHLTFGQEMPSFDVFLLLSVKIQTMSWKCNELSFFNHCKSLDMTVHLWQCHIWSPTQSAKCDAAMQHVTKCYMSSPTASKHASMFHAQIIFCFPCFGLTLSNST